MGEKENYQKQNDHQVPLRSWLYMLFKETNRDEKSGFFSSHHAPSPPKRMGRPAGKEIFGIQKLQMESNKLRFNSCFNQNTLTVAYLFGLLTYKSGDGRPNGMFKFTQSNLLH